MQSVEKEESVPEKSIQGDDLILSTENCSGVLSMKFIGHKKNSYAKTWCILKNKLLSVYKKKDGKPLEDINIEAYKIIPEHKNRSNNFSFRIINDWNEYIFGTKDENEYEVWINKLKSIKSTFRSENVVDRNSFIWKQFSRDESPSSFEKTDSIDKRDLNSTDNIELDDAYDACNTYESLNDSKINNLFSNTEENILSSDTNFNDTNCNFYFDENDTRECNQTNVIFNEIIDNSNTIKLQSMRNFDIESQISINPHDSIDIFDAESDFSDENCKGCLWLKMNTNYVKYWCALENKILGVYEKYNGKHLEDINIEVSRIIPGNKNRSKNFYFQIINDENEFSFGTRFADEYEEWINRLQSIALFIN